jgi:hypothetical protein
MGKLRTVLPFTDRDVIRDSAVQLVLSSRDPSGRLGAGVRPVAQLSLPERGNDGVLLGPIEPPCNQSCRREAILPPCRPLSKPPMMRALLKPALGLEHARTATVQVAGLQQPLAIVKYMITFEHPLRRQVGRGWRLRARLARLLLTCVLLRQRRVGVGGVRSAAWCRVRGCDDGAARLDTVSHQRVVVSQKGVVRGGGGGGQRLVGTRHRAAAA